MLPSALLILTVTLYWRLAASAKADVANPHTVSKVIERKVYVSRIYHGKVPE